MRPEARPRRVAVLAVTAALVLAGCTSGTDEPRARQSSSNVPFTSCSSVACTGTLSSGAYKIELPASWNGTLLIYSHGYRQAQPAPPRFTPVDTSAVDASDPQTATTLLSQGYALAGSAYASNGWAVADGVRAAEQLHSFFLQNVGQPYRTYVWGDSLGGLITQTIAEKDAGWVDGVAPMCGAVAGVVPNLDLALDIAYATKVLIWPQMKVVGYSSYQEAVQTWLTAARKLEAAASDVAGGGTAKVLYIGALVGSPGRTETYDGSTITSKVSGTVEGILTGLGYGTFGRYDVEQRYAGNVSTNVGTDYSGRVSAADAALIDAVTNGATARFTAELVRGPRVTADPSAQAAALADGGDPQGLVTRPTITLHTAADPLVLVQNESFFLARYQAQLKAGKATSGLVQLYTTPPATYPQRPGAPYGAGHCNFTSHSVVAVIDLLDAWVRDGVYPGSAAIAAAMGPDSGYTPGWTPGAWPDPAAVTVG